MIMPEVKLMNVMIKVRFEQYMDLLQTFIGKKN